MGEIIAGIIIGPTVMGQLAPGFYDVVFPKTGSMSLVLDVMVQLSVIMLLFVAGLEVQLHLLKKQTKPAVLTSVFSIVIPFIVGFGCVWLQPEFFHAEQNNLLPYALFLGVAMSISALPVIIRILMDLGIFKTDIGRVIIASELISDVVGWLLFSVVLSLLRGQTNFADIALNVFYVTAFIVFMFTLGRRIIDHRVRWIANHMSSPGAVISFLMGMCFLGAALTEAMGTHAIMGAFVMGIAFGSSPHLAAQPRDITHQFVTSVFAPLFFVSIGLRVNFTQEFDVQLIFAVLFIAIICKLLGAGLGARLGGMTQRESLAVGFGLNARGAMEIILGTIAFNAGLIGQSLFVALVIMALVTSIMSGPLMMRFIDEKKFNL